MCWRELWSLNDPVSCALEPVCFALQGSLNYFLVFLVFLRLLRPRDLWVSICWFCDISQAQSGILRHKTLCPAKDIGLWAGFFLSFPFNCIHVSGLFFLSYCHHCACWFTLLTSFSLLRVHKYFMVLPWEEWSGYLLFRTNTCIWLSVMWMMNTCNWPLPVPIYLGYWQCSTWITFRDFCSTKNILV